MVLALEHGIDRNVALYAFPTATNIPRKFRFVGLYNYTVHLEMSPKRFTVATTALLFSSALWQYATLNDCSFTQRVLNIHASTCLQRCLVLTWLVPRETAAVSAQAVYTIQPCKFTVSRYSKQAAYFFLSFFLPAGMERVAKYMICRE